MISQKYIDLMNQEFDGTNSPEQSRQLEDFLSGNEEARAYQRELALALNVFEKVAMLNPPRGLPDRIMARLGSRAGNHEAEDSEDRNGGLLAGCRNLFRLRLQPAYAYTFIGGLVLGLALFAGSNLLTTDQGPELSGYLSGTASHKSGDQVQGSVSTLAYPGLTGRIRTLSDGPDLGISLELNTTRPAIIRFRHGPHTTLQHFSSGNPMPSTLAASGSLVELSHEGEGKYDLVFHRDINHQSPITMLVYSEGRLIHTETLDEQEK